MTSTDALDEIAHCSFCGQPDTKVEKLVAGPGVYICNECVALAASIIDGTIGSPARPRTPVWESMTGDEMLSHIPRVAAHIEQAEADLRSWVQELRRRGVTWTRIGEALGITRQSAWERFSGEE
ncbi:ClpX C4-type zinc finger protein [Parafrankia sp. EUN1f]|uniref:ClpX C4-type zinc finger protein n=1 Tax=Parafrankia sp. EUN1f TaxID=102897 RepID=UPI0001C456E3|nr:ClpX C4-type zinc finger protein [Parafrankia sp. EUN1f]EFC78808.1 zinc finger C4 domain protein [Parafrankia sp. EUN1f]